LAHPVVGQDDQQKRFSWSADARFRPEPTVNVPDAPDRFRMRLRLRFAGTYRLADAWTVGGRFTTGNPDDPNSPYQDLGSVFDRFPFSLDRLNLVWTPRREWQVAGGKFAHPFVTNPIYAELVWDQDVQPEGIAVRYARGAANGRWRIGLASGQYVLLEQSRAGDVSATVAQGSGELSVGDHAVVGAALGWYEYGELEPNGADAVLRDNAGNATQNINGDGHPEGFQSDFRLIDLLVNVRVKGLPRILEVAGQYVRNSEAAIPDRQGFALGSAYGQLNEVGDWRAYYQYQRIEQDAVFSPFVQDDFVFATNFRGHVLGVLYQAARQLDLQGWVLVAKPNRSASAPLRQNQWRLRLDATVGFPR
jgi:hypothetical protein